MKILAYRSSRIMKVNAIVLAIALVLLVLVGVLAENKMLMLLPGVIALLNVVTLVDYFLSPKEMLAVEGDDIILLKSLKRRDNFPLSRIENVVYSCYSAKSKDGVLAIALSGETKPHMIQSVADVESARANILALLHDSTIGTAVDSSTENITTDTIVDTTAETDTDSENDDIAF